ncbi:MAG: hypothetical protein ACRDS0_32610 [Pseudonocardiaceae bacterium]
MQCPAQRQQLAEQISGQPVGDQGAHIPGTPFEWTPQTQGVGREGLFPLHREHLPHDRLSVIVGVQHDLHSELHATLV